MTWLPAKDKKGLYIPVEDLIEPAPDPTPDVSDPTSQDENLPSYILGSYATDIEARMYLAAAQNSDIDRIQFQISFVAGRNMPGEIRLDFLFTSKSILYPVFVDGGYWHKTPEARTRDDYQDAAVNNALMGTTAVYVQRVPDTDLESIEEAKIAVENILQLKYILER